MRASKTARLDALAASCSAVVPSSASPRICRAKSSWGRDARTSGPVAQRRLNLR